MAGYRVDPAALANADVALGGAAAEARAALDRVRAAAGGLLGSRWAGPAAAAFEAGWDEWLLAMTALLDGLEAMAAAVGESGAGYAATETGVRAAAARAAS